MTCDVSDVVGYSDIVTPVHLVKHVLVPHGLPCDVAGLLSVGDRCIH